MAQKGTVQVEKMADPTGAARQRDGTFAVVTRVPAGIVTPDDPGKVAGVAGRGIHSPRMDPAARQILRTVLRLRVNAGGNMVKEAGSLLIEAIEMAGSRTRGVNFLLRYHPPELTGSFSETRVRSKFSAHHQPGPGREDGATCGTMPDSQPL